MPRFENNILGLIPQTDWLQVGFNVARPNDPLEALIGDQKTDNLVAEWETIAAQYQIPVMAQFHAFDSEAQKTFRIPVDSHNIEKGLIKVKINQSERLRALMGRGVQNEEALYNYVFDDGWRLADQVFTRSKVAKAEMLATGKVTIKENNLDLTVDYGLADTQKIDIDFSDDADIFAQIQEIIDTARSNGVILNGMVVSGSTLTKIRKHVSVQKAINGNNLLGAIVKLADLEAFFQTEFGIGRIIVDDLTYGVDNGFGDDGRPSVTVKRYFPENTISFVGINQSGRLGVGLWGNPPEIDAENFYKGQTSSASPYVYVSQKAEWDPAVIWTKATGLYMPVLYNPQSLYIATLVDDEDSSGT